MWASQAILICIFVFIRIYCIKQYNILPIFIVYSHSDTEYSYYSKQL